MDVNWDKVWTTVASELCALRDAGLDRLLTEDVVRFATVRALVASGVSADRLRPEWPTSALGGGAVDLVVDQPPSVAIEFKYPREPIGTNAPWTQHLGGLLKDIYRLAAMADVARDRLAVHVTSDRLRRYLDGVADKYGVTVALDGGRATEIRAEQVLSLPQTALNPVVDHLDGMSVVRMRCVDRR